VRTDKEEKKFNTPPPEGPGRRPQLDCAACIHYNNEGLIIRGIRTYTNGNLIVCGICACIYYTNDSLILRGVSTYNNGSLIVCGICTCIYLYYDCVTSMNVEIINTNFSPYKLKRNCKQLSYTFRGWYMFHIVAVTDD